MLNTSTPTVTSEPLKMEHLTVIVKETQKNIVLFLWFIIPDNV